MARSEDVFRRVAERAEAAGRPPDPPPQPERPPQVYCVRPPSIGRLPALLLGEACGCWCHWNPEAEVAGKKCGRSYPCLGVDCPCPPDHRRGWYGWAPAVTRQGGARSLVSLSYHAACLLWEAYPDWQQWRGLTVMLERSPAQKGHPVNVICQGWARPDTVPEWFDPRAELVRLWGLDKPGECRVPCWDWPMEALPPPASAEGARARLWKGGE